MATKNSIFYVLNDGVYEEYLVASSAHLVRTQAGETVQDHIDNAVIHLTTAEKAKLGNLATDADATYATKAELAGQGSNFVVGSIAQRDAIAAISGTLAYVTDATSDTSVESGGATYIYNGASWEKISEWESMDVTLTWDSIQGKPSSTPSEIDSAVDDSHTHANATTLDKLSESGSKLAFESKEVAFMSDVANLVIVSDTQPTNQVNGSLWIKPVE